MNKKSQVLLLVVAMVAIIFTSCKSKYPGFDKTDNGLYYKFHIENKDAQKVESAVLTVNSATIISPNCTF